MTRDRDAQALAERMHAILGDGSFSANYKFALVIALLDVCIENTAHSGFMAAASHVERWRSMLQRHDAALEAIAQRERWRRVPGRTISVARALYLRLPDTAQLWEAPGSSVGVDRARISRALE